MRFRTRNYAKEEASCSLQRQSVQEHPLSFASSVREDRLTVSSRLLSTSVELEDAEQHDAILDPLRALSVHDPITADPFPDALSRPSRRINFKGSSDKLAEDAATDWNVHKLSILQRFTSSDTIRVSTTFDIISKDMKGRGRSLTAVHLKELDDPGKEADVEVKIISQQEYVTRLRELNEEISQAWLNHERVTALRLSVKVAKLLSDTSVPRFYPILFVLVTDVMETLGNLVWKRIKGKAELDENGNLIKLLQENFTADDVRQEAKDTCNNWFYKIGSIRELLPRIYLEIAILRCTYFLEKDPPKSSFHRLTMMIRGLADPLAAAYAYLYLARKGQSIIPFETGFLIMGLDDYLLLFQRVLSVDFDKFIVIKSGLDKQSYISLVEPVFELILQYISQHSNTEELLFLIRTFSEQQNNSTNRREESNPVSVVIHYLLKQLPPALVSAQALELSRIIKSSEDMSKYQYLNYRLFGTKLCECNPPREMQLPVLNDVWKVIVKFSNLLEYLTVADVFIEYILQCCSEVELCVLLRDITKHLIRGGVAEEAMMILESIVIKIMTYIPDLTHLLSIPYVVGILDGLKGDVCNSVYKHILAHVSRDNQTIRDPVTRHFLFELSKSLHKSLDSMSSEDDQRQIARLIGRFVQLVDFGRDLEQHLSFLVDCRGTFFNMEFLTETVVHLSNKLAVTTLQFLRGASTQRSQDFVKCCITFNEVTIPAMRSVVKRIHLYLETAEVAIINALVSHCEGLIKCSMTCLQEIGNTEDAKDTHIGNEVLIFIRKLCSFLIVIPGHPEHGTFYLLGGLIQLLNTQSWLKRLCELECLCGFLLACSALSQDSLPYHVNSMEIVGNDELFSGELTYHEELASITNAVIKKLYASINEAENSGTRALYACQVLLTAFQMNNESMIQHCTVLLQAAKLSLPKNSRYLSSVIAFSQRRGLSSPMNETLG